MPPHSIKKRQRPAYSCTECTRRKLRCSKHIPCSACIERGMTQECHRRPHTNPTISASRGKYALHDPDKTPTAAPASHPIVSTATVSSFDAGRDSPRGNNSVEGVGQDAAIMLEFLALSRRQVLQDAHVAETQLSEKGCPVEDTVELLFTAHQVEQMMIYHQDYLAWTHNVVHLPSFRTQCQVQLAGEGVMDDTWVSLYYAMLAVTLYHTHPSRLEEFGVIISDRTVESCFERSINSLNAANFMKNHTLFSVQAICLLIYIGHNLGQSDRISVLLASASRIAQCLGLHRMDPENLTAEKYETESILHTQNLIDEEVSKRAWWFLVRQDWLQIPFNNTYSIHPTQFSTPMPKNCDEDISRMVVEGQVLDRSPEHYTQGSYTSVLNHVSGVIWKLQDRMCRHERPNENDESLRRLYCEVLQADAELRALIAKIPSFLKDQSGLPTACSVQIEQQRALLSLGLAHKFYSIHRHFQIPSLKNPWFAYTKVSCLPIMRRHLTSFLSLPKSTHTHVMTNLWTANTQVLTAALWLLFELIFSREESAQIYEAEEIRELASRSLGFLRENQHKSRIAKRGVTLIESLLEIDQAVTEGAQNQFSLRGIISRVINSDSRTRPDISSEYLNTSLVDLMSVDGLSWEDLMNAFVEV